MEAAAKFITAMALLVGAVIWPTLLLVLATLFRRELRLAATHLPQLLNRITKMKIAGIEAELDRVADAAISGGLDRGGAVTSDQTRTAAFIEAQSKHLGITAILTELDRLCLEYDAVRRAMSSGDQRTEAMTRILVKMRSLAPATAHRIGAYQSSPSAGSRLAAVAIMQMVPTTIDLPWLAGRFAEEQPFIFYHAALALQNAINQAPRSGEAAIRLIAEEALETVLRFDGTPDDSTIMVLQNIIDY